MGIQEVIKDLFALFNIIVICMIMEQRRKIEKMQKRSFFMVMIGILLSVALRFAGNHIHIHILYIYLSITIIILFLGTFVWKYPFNYSFIVNCFFLLLISLGQVFACIVEYVETKRLLTELPNENQMHMLVTAEMVIMGGIIAGRRIINKIPLKITTLNFMTIIMPNIITILVIASVADKIYYTSDAFSDTKYIIAIVIAGLALAAGSICNIVVLEYYLNVKWLENEKKLQISEIAFQYDYYKKLEKDMREMRRFAHDMRNHLEALKDYQYGSFHDQKQKNEYIENMEEQLNLYESYYHTGNTFIDSLLHSKKVEADKLEIEFKALVDLKLFSGIKNEDLCVIFSNAIDNAIQECRLRKEEIESGNMILVRSKRYRGFLSIVFENSIRESQAEKMKVSEIPETTKGDKLNHGFGIKNIKSAVKKYGGEICISIKNKMFCLSIIIPIQNK